MKRLSTDKKNEFIIPGIAPHTIFDKQGNMLGVFFETEDYKKLMEEIEDFFLGAIATAIKKKGEPTKPLAQVKKELKAKKKVKRTCK